MAEVLNLECSECGDRLPAEPWIGLCPDCQRPLLARYDLTPLSQLSAKSFAGRLRSLWRYHEVLPLHEGDEPLSLGEGWTPLLSLPTLGRELGLSHLYGKNEGANPTGSFKDRGMAVALHQVRAHGISQVSLPSAGNAAGSASAYARRGNLTLRLAMPDTTPLANRFECDYFGFDTELVPGSLREAGVWLKENLGAPWVDLSTMKEPYRLEGKKTMGYELYEQGCGQLPDVIVYPAGGGTGLIGMGKAFDELEEAGLIQQRPRMIAVQAEGCAPIVDAWETGKEQATGIEDPQTMAAGLRVPAPIGDRLMLRTIRESRGCAVSVSDASILEAAGHVARSEGLFVSPEAAATVAALPLLRERQDVSPDDKIVVFLTASGLKNVDDYRSQG